MPSAAQDRFTLHRTATAGLVAVEAAARRAFPRHMHDQFGIGAIHQGAQKSFSGRGMVEAQAGDVITVNPGEIHDGLPLDDGMRRWRMVYLDPALVALALADRDGGGAGRELPAPVIRDGRLTGLVDALFAAQTAPAAPLRRDEALLLMLDALLREGGPPPTAPVPTAIRRARQRLDDAPADPASLADLAAECGLSRFQLLRGFARATGLTPHAYQMRRRTALARRRIADGMPLAQAAMASGFSDQSHMTRQFVRLYGMTPGVYAAALR